MIKQWEVIYLLFLNELKQAEKDHGQGLGYAESGFNTSIKYWLCIRRQFYLNREHSDEEEIGFFRNIKPRFTCFAEYFLLMSRGLLFSPEMQEHQMQYWKEEKLRRNKFMRLHHEFIHYYEGGNNALDTQYFLLRNNNMDLPPQERIYADMDCRSSHDHLVRRLFAANMYEDFLKTMPVPRSAANDNG